MEQKFNDNEPTWQTLSEATEKLLVAKNHVSHHQTQDDYDRQKDNPRKKKEAAKLVVR